jgi:hypothetical protein
VKWSQICSPLGLQNLSKFNQALLGKWLRCFATEREAYWCLLVEAKYGCMNGGWYTKAIRVRKLVRRGWGVFLRSLRFDVRDGSHIRFWHNIWCGDQSLKEVFLELFCIARHKEAWFKDICRFLMVLFNGMYFFYKWPKIGR